MTTTGREMVETDSTASTILTTALVNRANQEHTIVLRQAAAIALGKISNGSDEVIQALIDVAGRVDEKQSLRSFCIEALMDLGPDAAAATSVLQRILKQDEDEDLQKFAWAALKSVTAESEDHPCGETVAEHMRSLYQTGIKPDDDG